MPILSPEVILAGFAILLLVWDALYEPDDRLVGAMALLATVVAGLASLGYRSEPAEYFWGNLYIWDDTAKFYKVLFCAVSAFCLWISLEYRKRLTTGRAEFYIIQMFCTTGMLLLASVADFMLLFVALELVTVSFYVLVAFQRRNPASLEAGIKYLIIGGVASAFLIMGIAYIFGLTGSTQFTALASIGEHVPLGLQLGIIFVLIGIGFKIAAFPFHIWSPDVYEGAPTPVTAFLSVGSKAAGFVILIRLVTQAIPIGDSDVWTPALKFAAGASLLLGNLAAIPQRSIKRMLAYSSIGHSGFILLAIIPSAETSSAAVAVYLVSYFLATMTAFLVVTVVSRQTESDAIHSYAGLWQRSPIMAGALAMALISLGGIPPLVGFMGKLAVFSLIWKQQFYWLFSVGVVSALAGLYYYLNVVKVMFWSQPIDSSEIRAGSMTTGLLIVMMAAIVAFGFFAGWIANFVSGVGISVAM